MGFQGEQMTPSIYPNKSYTWSLGSLAITVIIIALLVASFKLIIPDPYLWLRPIILSVVSALGGVFFTAFLPKGASDVIYQKTMSFKRRRRNPTINTTYSINHTVESEIDEDEIVAQLSEVLDTKPTSKNRFHQTNVSTQYAEIDRVFSIDVRPAGNRVVDSHAATQQQQRIAGNIRVRLEGKVSYKNLRKLLEKMKDDAIKITTELPVSSQEIKHQITCEFEDDYECRNIVLPGFDLQSLEFVDRHGLDVEIKNDDRHEVEFSFDRPGISSDSGPEPGYVYEKIEEILEYYI